MGDYDAVVVGAGLGGLSAAANLAVAGKKVLLLEKHSTPGGYASTFRRGRFEFDISLHELSGLGHAERRGPLWRTLEHCGVAHKVEFLDIPDFYRSVYPDLDLVMPAEREGFEEVLCEHFPGDAEGIRKFSSIMFALLEEVSKFSQEAMMKDPTAFTNLMTYAGSNLADVLNVEVKDEKARAMISQLWGYYGLPPSRLSFLLFAIATATYLKYGPVHIKGKSQALSQAFVESILENGGDVWLNNGASRILVGGGRVKGVVAEDGSEIAADYVVSNANPISTCIDLIGREHVPSWYLKRLGWGKIGISLFDVFLGLDCPVGDLGLENHEIMLGSDYDFDAHYDVPRNQTVYEPNGCAVAPYNVLDPEFSPPGTCVVTLTSLGFADPWLKLSPSEYVEAKNTMASRFIDLAARVAPGIRDHIEVVEVATPLTHMRYTGNVAGAVYGYENSVAEAAVQRLPHRGPIEGLYFAGAWTRNGGGFQPCIDAGHDAAVDIVEDMERGGFDSAVLEGLKTFCENQAAQAAEIDMEPHAIDRSIAGMHPRRLVLKVSEVIEETESAKTLRLVAVRGGLPWFRAGQYINVFVETGGVMTSRPYSIASAPGKPYYDITVRRKAGGFVSAYLLDEVKAGDGLESTGPSGSFYHEPLSDGSDLVFLAGGSGITPFISIMREVVEGDLPLRIHLLYGSRDPEDIIFRKELAQMGAEHDNIDVDFIISEPGEDWGGLCGFIDADMISGAIGAVEGRTFYICGPAEMYPFCEGALNLLEVPAIRVKKEAYGPPDDVTMEEGWPGVAPQTEFEVIEERSNVSFMARAGEPLINSMERAGLVVEAVCRSGECTVCRTRLVSGEVFAPARVLRRWADEHFGYIHPCMSYPLSDLRIRL
ncbi:MAG: FAD-binding protein [Actinobacteria bacterium]|jgi:phytoene dehydrogenase-like protein/ferredoxin-NADP reductase|nr:MAG: FAD-binding protein [Actinomycetota bacterium]